ncbi:putative nucleotide-diphospho-sugar transferase [Elongatibacter sediminis]|uniref:Nucleotide-diphospho-sugar transferase n=1 Tax=Elongatibacter sediminis TaxID=3119006 RepID=A0AAW9RJG9_9GAMM
MERSFEIIPFEALNLENGRGMLFQYTPFELCCALKPFALRHLLDQGFERVIYLDADMAVFSGFGPVLEALGSADVLVTPHLDAPFPQDGLQPDDGHLLLSGMFNLGFIGVRDTHQGRAFINWWADKLERGCIEDHFNGLFVDQKYVDLAVGLFEGLRLLRHPGCNVAYWNLHSRKVTRDGQDWRVNGEPLVFFHFSDFDPERPRILSGHQTRFDLSELPDLAVLFENYSARLRENGLAETRQLPYGYSRYRQGGGISPAMRRAYLRASDRDRVINAFDRAQHPMSLRIAASVQWIRLSVTRLAHKLRRI